jgi:ectonucleotide pyrophosphatase/phosphodiesterase family member 5
MIRLSRRWILLILLALSFQFPGTVQAQDQVAEYVVIIVLDGCRADYLDLAQLPNIKGMMSRGVSYTNAWTGQMMNSTAPGHATIGTGVFPNRHTITGFHLVDAATRKFTDLSDLKQVMDGAVEKKMLGAQAPTLAGQFRSKYPSAKVLSISASKFYAAAAMGNYAADYVVFGHWIDGFFGPLAVNGREPPQELMNDPLVRTGEYVDTNNEDTWVANAVSAWFSTLKPQVLMVNLPAMDEAGHLTGGPIAPTAMSEILSNADLQIGRIRSLYESAGMLEKTLFIVTADHGMVPNMKKIDSIPLLKAMKAAGASILRSENINHQWLVSRVKARNIAESLAGSTLADGLLGIYYKTGRPGVDYRYKPAKSPSVATAFDYLLDTLASPNAPDLVLMLPDKTIQNLEMLNSRGTHEVVSWETQHIPLIIEGPLVKKGKTSDFPARLVDIAPTVLALAGIEPQDMDGVILADCMRNPQAPQTGAQRKIKPKLVKVQAAFISLFESAIPPN